MNQEDLPGYDIDAALETDENLSELERRAKAKETAIEEIIEDYRKTAAQDSNAEETETAARYAYDILYDVASAARNIDDARLMIEGYIERLNNRQEFTDEARQDLGSHSNLIEQMIVSGSYLSDSDKTPIMTACPAESGGRPHEIYDGPNTRYNKYGQPVTLQGE